MWSVRLELEWSGVKVEWVENNWSHFYYLRLGIILFTFAWEDYLISLYTYLMRKSFISISSIAAQWKRILDFFTSHHSIELIRLILIYSWKSSLPSLWCLRCPPLHPLLFLGCSAWWIFSISILICNKFLLQYWSRLIG